MQFFSIYVFIHSPSESKSVKWAWKIHVHIDKISEVFAFWNTCITTKQFMCKFKTGLFVLNFHISVPCYVFPIISCKLCILMIQTHAFALCHIMSHAFSVMYLCMPINVCPIGRAVCPTSAKYIPLITPNKLALHIIHV